MEHNLSIIGRILGLICVPEARGHSYEAKRECPCYNLYATLPALLMTAQTLHVIAHSTYILKDAYCDCGILL